MNQNGPFWPEEVHFGPFRSATRTLAIRERNLEVDFKIAGFVHCPTRRQR